VLVEHTYNDYDDRRTRLYLEAEALLARLNGELSRAVDQERWAWEAAADRSQTMGGVYYVLGLELPDVPLADAGDHFAGMAS